MSREVKDVCYILAVAAGILLVVLSVGCKTMPGKLEIDTMFFDIEYEGTPK